MTFKKIFMLICLVICLFAMASVCASDADNTTMECTDKNLEINEDSQLTQTNIETDTDSADDSATDVLGKNLTVEGNTFEDIGNKIIEADAGDTIHLNATTYKGSGNWIEIGKSITIEGNGAVLDAQGLSRIFYVNASDVTIKNITFINGHDEGDGGASHDKGDGGAIYWGRANGKVLDCNFVNCHEYDGISAGAIYWDARDGIVSGCSFMNCSSGQTGGAISWNNDSGIISGCSFVNCISYNGLGGAISSGPHHASDCVISECSFVNCSADDGGAIYWGRSNGTISGCSFVNCFSSSGGGAIYINIPGIGVDCSVSGCSFMNCSSYGGGGGGAIWWMSIRVGGGSVYKCSFVNCAERGSDLGGGAILWRKGTNNGSVISCSFVNCSAKDGGAIYWGCSNGIVSECNFVNCVCGPFGAGNSILWEYHDDYGYGYLSNSTFRHSDLTVNDELSCLTLTLEDNLNNNYDVYGYSFYKNNLSYWNGSAYVETPQSQGNAKSVNQWVKLEIYNSAGDLVEVFSQLSDGEGQLVYDYLKLSNGNYTYKAYIEDRYNIGEGSFGINMGDFNRLKTVIDRASNNSIINLTCNYTFTDGFDNNLIEGIVIDKPITINGNGATIDAKGLSRIFNVTEGVTLTLANVTLINGHAEDGGAIYSKGTLVILNSTLQANHASSQGGAIYSNGNLTIVNSVIDDNAASFGVVNLVGTGSIVNSTLSNNNGEWGGAVYSFFANLTITGSNITDNYARVAGAGVYNYGGNVTINSSTLKDNDAPVGSAVWTITEEGVVLDDVRLVDNAGEALNVYDGGTIDTSRVKFMTAVAFKIEDINDTPMGCEITINITELNKGKEFTGNVSVFIGDENYTVEIINGTGLKKIIPDLNPGIYTVRLTFNETEIYEAASAQSNPFHIRQKQNINAISIVLSESAFTYNAEVQKPTVTLSNGLILKEGVDYVLKWSVASPINAGTYTITVTGIGAYNGTKQVTFMINKAANPLKVKAKTVKVKFSKLIKKAQKLKVTKVVKFTKKGQGTLTYKKVKGNKKITINKKTGKVTIKKGLKKGTYKVKVKIKANGNANYKASAFKTVTFKIKIK